jgi:hypothetical protein
MKINMKIFQKIYYKMNNLLFQEVRKNKNLIKINTSFSRGALTSQLRNIDETSPITWEFSAFSQNGEDGILDYLLKNLLYSNRYFIEIGANNCIDNNTAWLAYGKNYSGIMIEGNKYLFTTSYDTKPWYTDYIHKFVDLQNISFLSQNSLHLDPDVFSLDIDGNDYYIMKKILDDGFRPKVVVVEYNSAFGPDQILTIAYKSNFNFIDAHSSGLYYGVSISLWKKLFSTFGYEFISVESNGVNAFFVNPNVFNQEFIKNLKKQHFLENVHQLRRFKNTWNHQFDLIKHLKFCNPE